MDQVDIGFKFPYDELMCFSTASTRRSWHGNRHNHTYLHSSLAFRATINCLGGQLRSLRAAPNLARKPDGQFHGFVFFISWFGLFEVAVSGPEPWHGLNWAATARQACDVYVYVTTSFAQSKEEAQIMINLTMLYLKHHVVMQKKKTQLVAIYNWLLC